ncbi:MAG: FHA domain-containing protein [Planctomycetota bacterium]|jgi:hypothetical protein
MLRLTITTPAGRATVESNKTELLIGRREGSDLRLDDPGASRNHCVLRVDPEGALLIDLGSHNGVKVDGKKVPQALLKVGGEFRIGKTTIRIDELPGIVTGLQIAEESAATITPIGATAPVAHGAQPDFAREVREMLARTPWYFISLVVHALIVLVLDFIPYSITIEWPQRILEASTPGEMPGADTELEEMAPPELEEPDEILDNAIDEEPEASDPSQGSAPEDTVEPDPTSDPNDIGMGKRLTQKISPLSIKPKVKQAGNRLDKGNLEGEHEAAKRVIERGAGSGLRRVRAIPPDYIIVIKGDFDKAENVLDRYGIPHTLVDRDQFERRPFRKAKVIIANCARQPERRKRNELASRIKRFVNRGGWFVSSDWALEPYLTIAWPTYVQKIDRPKKRQPDTTVVVDQAMQSPLLKGVFARRQQTRWWLEESSIFFRAGSKAHVLVGSAEMKQEYGANAVVVEFKPGRGRVLHLLGHFYQEDGNRAGVVAMHRLIVNFLMERFRPGG